MDTQKKISLLQNSLKNLDLDAYIMPSSDPHLSEYVAEHWKARQWISGFTGSAGIVVITNDHAGLWTDSRYFIRAEEELVNSNIVLHKQKIPHAPEHIGWIIDNLKKGSRVACDGRLFSKAQIQALRSKFKPAGILLEESVDLISSLWRDRPSLPKGEIFEHELKYAGLSRTQKVGQIRGEMKTLGAKYHWISTLDDIAWTLNIRSNDIKCNPVSISYLMIGMEKLWLFIDTDKVPQTVKTTFENTAIELLPYEKHLPFIEEFNFDGAVLIDPGNTNAKIFSAFEGKATVLEATNIPLQLKSIKNNIEIKNIRNAMIKDGVALVKLFRWLSNEVKQRGVPETEVATVLADFRKSRGEYHGESFDAIVGYEANGADVHYHPEPDRCAIIENKGMLLLDSGGQYFSGTTDITRTVIFGDATEEQQRNFTLVLKGHIELATSVFPKGTVGAKLDLLARMHLWKHGLNYGHGTGHGVGFFNNVHEAPQGFSANLVTGRGSTPIEEGTLTSNEPGYYKDGEYGIRIENLVLCKKIKDTQYGTFLGFETLTLFPIDLNLIQENLLTRTEVNWLNNYHDKVKQALEPHLNEEEKSWLDKQCKSI